VNASNQNQELILKTTMATNGNKEHQTLVPKCTKDPHHLVKKKLKGFEIL